MAHQTYDDNLENNPGINTSEMDLVRGEREEEREEIQTSSGRKSILREREEIQTSEKGAVHLIEVKSDERFQQWLAALKARYWVDFGNQSAYKVDWLRKTDVCGKVVELAVQLYKIKDEKSGLLFTITAYLSKRKIMIQGKFRDMWKSNEFIKLRSFVDGLCEGILSDSQVSVLYSKVFECENIRMLEGVNLDVLEDASDDEESSNVLELESIDEESKKAVNYVKSPRRKVIPKSKDLLQREEQRKEQRVITKSKYVGKLNKQPEMSVMKDNLMMDKCITRIMERVEEIELKLTCVEEVVSKAESQISEVEFQRLQSNNNVMSELSSLKKELISDLQVQRKNEAAAFKKLLDNLMQEVDASMSKYENELKSFQGRLGSLVDEKVKLQEKTSSLENHFVALNEENVLLRDKVSYLEKQLKITVSDKSMQCEENANMKEKLVSLENQLSSISKSAGSRPSREFLLKEKSYASDKDSTVDNSNLVNTARRDILERDDNTTEEIVSDPKVARFNAEFDFVFICDSNRKFLDMKKLFPGRSYKLIPCGSLDKAIQIIKSPRFAVSKALLIHVGVNDLEHFTVEEIAEKQTELLSISKSAFPDKTIIISGLTPRMDELGSNISQINSLFFKKISDSQEMRLVNHENLNDEQYFYDAKHLNRSRGVPLFAKNLKQEIKALFPSFRRNQSANFSNPRKSNQFGHVTPSRVSDQVQRQQQANYNQVQINQVQSRQQESQQVRQIQDAQDIKTVASQLYDISGMLKTFIHTVNNNNAHYQNLLNQRVSLHPGNTVSSYHANYAPMQRMSHPAEVQFRSAT